MAFRYEQEEIAENGEGSDHFDRHRGDVLSFSQHDYRNQHQRRSRPIAIPQTRRAEETEERPIRQPVAMSLPATLYAPLLGSSLPVSRPPPFQLSDAADPMHEPSVPYGSLREHRRHERLGTSVPNPQNSGMSIADRIRGASKSSKSSQISSLSRMMEEVVRISPSDNVPKSPVIERKEQQLLRPAPAEPNPSSSLTGLQILQSRGLPSPARTTSIRSSEFRDSSTHSEQPEEGAFELDME